MKTRVNFFVFFGFLLLFEINFSLGQVIDASTFGPDSKITTNQYLEVLRTQDFIPFESLHHSNFQDQFEKVGEEPVIYVGYNELNYWFRFKINNPDTVEKKLMFLIGKLGINDGEMFQSTSTGWESLGKIGYSYPFENRPYHYVNYVYPVTLQPKTTHAFYLYTDESHAYRVVATALLHPLAMKKMESKVYLTFGFMLGILVLFCLLNMFLFITTKDKIHFIYAIYIITEALVIIKNNGLDAQFLGMDSRDGFRSFGVLSIGVLTVALLIHVLQVFFSNISSKSLLYKATTAVRWVLIGIGILHLIVFYIEPSIIIEKIVYELANKGIIIGLLCALVNCIYGINKGLAGSTLILIGLIILTIGGMERVLLITSSSYLFPPTLFQVGMVIETIIISFGLMYRYGIYQKEKESLKWELDKQMSKNVNEIIDAQENERKRIAEDLHDDLGSNLAVIKLNLQSLKGNGEQKESIIQLVDDTASRVRQVSHNLMPPGFASTDLKDILNSHFQHLNNETDIHFDFHLIGDNKNFNKEKELMIYRIIMELTNNILKHSKATEATVQLFHTMYSLELIVEDNGIGISGDREDGIGLKNIQSRVGILQGDLTIDSNSLGTTVIISIPLISQTHENKN